MSRDKVHTHERGDDEASAGGLLRVRSIDDMLEILGVENPAGKLARLLLEPIWDDLRAAGLPLLPVLSLRKVDNGVFRSGEAGIEKAAFDFKASAENGGGLEAHIEITIVGENITEASLRQIALDGQSWQPDTLKIMPNKPAPSQPSRLDERLDALREVIGD